MQRLLSTVLFTAALSLIAGCNSTPKNTTTNTAATTNPAAPAQASQQNTFSDNELVTAVSTHLGVTSESAATAIERLFKDKGRPVGYITGEEGGGAFTVGARYGKGTLWMKNGETRKVYWQGQS